MAIRYSYRSTPRSRSGSLRCVHNSWLPGTQITSANRSRSVPSAHSMSAANSPTSPATMSQSADDVGRSPATSALFSPNPTCRSLTASSLGPVASMSVSSGIVAEVLQDGKNPAVVGAARRQIELGEDVGDIFLHSARADLQQRDYPAVR